MPETMAKTNLKNLGVGSRVNLERALTLNKPLGGHIVTGHIDGVGIILKKQPIGNAVIFNVQVPEDIGDQIVDKGSVAINGISLTIASIEKDSFAVSIIPHTASHTTLLSADVGEVVNIECDVLGKYVKKKESKERGKPKKDISMEFLRNHGFA